MPHNDSSVRNPLDSSMGRFKKIVLTIALALFAATAFAQDAPTASKRFEIGPRAHQLVSGPAYTIIDAWMKEGDVQLKCTTDIRGRYLLFFSESLSKFDGTYPSIQAVSTDAMRAATLMPPEKVLGYDAVCEPLKQGHKTEHRLYVSERGEGMKLVHRVWAE